MATYKNHEGYVDSTAYLAELSAEKAERKKRRRKYKKCKEKKMGGYRLGELYAFRLCVRQLGLKMNKAD
jgi:hypothetical protein